MVANAAALSTQQSARDEKQALAPEFGYGKIIMWTLLFQFAWSWGSIKYIITQGAMPGPDDFTRLYQVRSLLSGQSWFDSTAYGMLSPAGADIHWSRIVDGPIAGLIYIINMVVEQQLAERIVSILWPSILLVLTVLVITKICDSLFSNYNRLLPVFFTVLCVSSLAQFVPGRLDHHNLQILLYVSMLWCLVNWQKPSANVLAGILIPLSISIGLDVLVFFILFMAWFGIEWVLGSDQKGAALRRFGLSLGAATLLLYPINIGPAKWLIAYCDANSIVFFTAQMMIAGSMLAMSVASPFLDNSNTSKKVSTRLGTAGLLACTSGVALLIIYPECLGGPFAAVSEELNTRWLSKVSEAKDLFTVLRDYPEYWIKTVAYFFVIFATGIWVLRQKLENKMYLVIIFAAFIASVLLSLIQYRTIRIGFFAAIPITVLATELFVRKLADKFGQGSLLPMAGQISAVILLSTASWAFAGSLLLAKPSISTEQAASDPDSLRKTCFYESDFELLASLPVGKVFSGLYFAPSILIFTDKTVITGPYHRNQQGILDVLDFFETDVSRARELADSYEVDYVALCRGYWTSKNKGGNENSKRLVNRLVDDNPPNWLERLSGAQDKMLVFRVKK